MIFSPSGGGLYHWRALTRRNLWQPFTSQLAQWLESWPVAPHDLLLIGPSGGHTLPTSWLGRFKKITAIDIDPLAGPLFRLRHRRVPVTFHKQNIFTKNGRFIHDILKEWRDRHPEAAILFCNVLGQLPLETHCSENEWSDFLHGLPAALGASPWASYHDAYTFEGLPASFHALVAKPYLQGASIDDTARALGDHSSLIVDHMTTGNWTAPLAKTRWAWSLTPTNLHLLEGCRTHPPN